MPDEKSKHNTTANRGKLSAMPPVKDNERAKYITLYNTTDATRHNIGSFNLFLNFGLISRLARITDNR